MEEEICAVTPGAVTVRYSGITLKRKAREEEVMNIKGLFLILKHSCLPHRVEWGSLKPIDPPPPILLFPFSSPTPSLAGKEATVERQ